MARRPLLARVAQALTALAGELPTPVESGEPRRLLAPMTAPVQTPDADQARAMAGNGTEWLNGTGYAGSAQVRTANPQEYKRDGATVRAEGFNKHPVVQACMRTIVDQVAQIPYVVLDKAGPDGKRVGTNHPLQTLLDFPGKRLTARQLRARMTLDLLGYGNALTQIVRVAPERGRPLGLRPLNVEGVQTVWVDPSGDPAKWEVSNWDGRVLTIPVNDLIHLRDLDMPRPFMPDVFGYPRGAAAIQSIIADNEATGYVRQTVTNDGTPTFVTLLEQGTSQADAMAMQERYTERVVRRGNRGKPAFFSGVRDVKALGFTLSELEFPDLRRVSREDICAAFGVDPRIVGISSATNDGGLSGAQYQEARTRLIQHTVEPLLGLIVDELNAWLAPEFGNVVIDYDRDILRDLVEDDAATSTRIIAELGVPGLRTLQEGRVALKLPAEPKATDTVLVPFGTQLMPVAAAVLDPRTVLDPGPDPNAPAPPDGAEGGDAGDEPTDEPRALPARTSMTRTDASQMDPRREHWLRQIKLLDADEVTYAAAARTQFASDAASVVGIFEDAAATAARGIPDGATAEQRRAINDPNRQRAAQQAVRGYLPGGEYHEAWRQRFEELIRRTYTMGNSAEIVGTVGGLDFRLPNAFVERAIQERAIRLATFVGETTARQITAVVGAAERAGMSMAETARLIKAAVYGQQMTDARALTIARTESAGAMSQGQWDQAKESGIYQSKEWLAFDDNETRPTHNQAHAQGRIAIDAVFQSNKMRFPMEPGAPAKEVVNCRCRPVFYIESVTEEVL